MQMHNGAWSVFKREMLSYFQSPVAYIFMALFIISLNSFTFFFSRLLEKGEASLELFFSWHPWLYTLLIPAITMRLWSEEKRLGTIELLQTLPLSTWQLVIGKFGAAWAFTSLSLLTTLPIWWTVNYLGNPDNGLILAGYIGSILMAGAYVAIGASISSATSSHIIAFVMGVAVCMLFTVAGSALGNGLLQPFLPEHFLRMLSQFGFATNYADITRGFVEWPTLFYFASIIVIGLFINRLLITHAQTSRDNSLLSIGLALSIICLLCINILANIWLAGKQFDFTAEKSFTLSKSTKNILASLDEPLYATLYYSEEQAKGLPAIQAHASRVKALLREYAHLSAGKVKLNIVNPTPFSDEEQHALKHTITGTAIDNLDNKLYFGLSVSNSVDRKKVISYIDPSRNAFLEYDLTRILYQLAQSKRPTIGVLGWLPMRQGMTDTMPQPTTSWVILKQMEALFDVQYFNFYSEYLHDKLSVAELDILMVIHPFYLDAPTAKYIHDYVVGGGKAMFFVDGYQDNRQVKEKYSDLNRMIGKWGISTAIGKVIADKNYATRITKHEKKNEDEDYTNIVWLTIPDKGLNDDDIITSNLTSMQLPATSHIKSRITNNENLTWTPLIASSNNASEVIAERLDDKTQVNGLLDNFESDDRYFTLAGRLSGTLTDQYQATRTAPFIAKPTEVVIVADADMLRDDTWVRSMKTAQGTYLSRFSDNGAFVLNSIDYMTGAEDLIALRSRSQKKRYFNRIRDIQKNAEIQYRKQEKDVQTQLDLAIERLEETLKTAGNQKGALLGERFRKQTTELRSNILSHQKKLQHIKVALRSGIESLSYKIIWLNVGGIPLMIIILAFILPKRLRGTPHYEPLEKDS